MIKNTQKSSQKIVKKILAIRSKLMNWRNEIELNFELNWNIKWILNWIIKILSNRMGDLKTFDTINNYWNVHVTIGSTLACKLYLTHIISFFVTFFLFLFRWGHKMSTRGFSILNFRQKTIENPRNLDIYSCLFHVFDLLCWYRHTYFICI